MNPTQYRQVFGSLQYLSFTRSDISFVINKLSQFMHRPPVIHWFAVKRVLLYLKGTLNHGLILRKHSSLHLYVFVDVVWVGKIDDRISTSTDIIFLGANPISWSSTIEAEYRVIATIAVELN